MIIYLFASSSNFRTIRTRQAKARKFSSFRLISKENLNLKYGILYPHTEADLIFQQLEKDVVYYKDELTRIQVFGKWHSIPRQQVAFGDEGTVYRFSGNTFPAKSWGELPMLLGIKQAVEDALDNKHLFNFVLINRYKDGADHMGEHRDDEKELDHNAPIASVSFGQARDFLFKHKDARGRNKSRPDLKQVSLLLQHGSLLVMQPPTNTYWYHSLPVRKNLKLPRINLTFRVLKPVIV